ncbi:alpha-hydroxy acid oxidase [Streptomyces sp. NPDC002520]
MADRDRLSRMLSIEDLHAAARHHWPRTVRDYVDGGADDERGLALNTDAFDRYAFMPRVLRGIREPDLTGTFLNHRAALPLGLAPTGYTRLMHREGETAAADAASAAGIPYVVSTMSTTPMAALAARGGDVWFQLYATRDTDGTTRRVEMARDSGCRVLVVTVDSAVTGNRVRDLHNGFALPPRLGPFIRAGALARPRWLAGFLRSGRITFANFHPESSGVPLDTATFAARNFDPAFSWADVERLRNCWTGPLVLKGISNPLDAARARAEGVDGVVLSNHGGRQLDASLPPLLLLADVRARVGPDYPVYVDSGIRRGSDIALAIALGADGCFVGRAYLYGLGAAGGAGCLRAVEILADELRRTMLLLGVAGVDELRGQGATLVRVTAHCPVTGI